jgi:hypothetical protein
MKRLLILLCVALLPVASWAQYSGNNQTNVISGVTSNWAGTYTVGLSQNYNALIVTNGGRLEPLGGTLRIGVAGNSNLILVADSGSVISNLDRLGASDGKWNTVIISNGATAKSGSLQLAQSGASHSNQLIVSGGVFTGSTASCDITLGSGTSFGCQLIVTNSGKVFGRNIRVGGTAGATNFTVEVYDTATVNASGFMNITNNAILVYALGTVNPAVSCGTTLTFGGSLNTLNIKDGGGFTASNCNYTLISYASGLVTNDGTITIGTTPNAGYQYTIGHGTLTGAGVVTLYVSNVTAAAAPPTGIIPPFFQ